MPRGGQPAPRAPWLLPQALEAASGSPGLAREPAWTRERPGQLCLRPLPRLDGDQ